MSLPSTVEGQGIGADGSASPLTPQEVALALRADALLRGDAHWAALASPRLARVEANRGLSPATPGFLYLRYLVASGMPQEFWAHAGARDHVAWKSGQVGVRPAEG